MVNQEENVVNYKPQKFIIWLFVVSSTIMFGGWTSYYIVFSASKGKGHGLVLPDMFMYSTLVLILSSVTMFLAARALKSGDTAKHKIFLWLTFALGLGFGIMQFQAWTALFQSGAVIINNNAAISMIYIVSGFHLVHIVAGLALIISCLIGAYRNVASQKAIFRQEIASIFWHFLDILWIYLYVFLLLKS
ncbi:MAG: heme-copper oxidase subunit III [Pedobacter sp.]|nr:MAG: heme-copper oxidase subunit III [Pedobacter sp.]